ncbi:MAG TPA: MoxR family ATPase [Candidatus Cloacimonadota bacterium]|jgi:MoxR-like ATPase|nr:MoxR family ATPase [Candidatus Cloacimonadota bacterium]HOD53161.1 MoxR family ATPase [Candidatus Cloacimonadota bacterium]HPM00908.1 MoxR family ATPase [Candidatus Cloacimonadota bacterium]
MSPQANNLEILDNLKNTKTLILNELHKVIIGQDKVIEQIMIALFANGHCLIEGVPGLAKTLMISTLAKILQLKFSRIQFTPDLMPSDITGTEVLTENKNDGSRYFQFIKGPVFANLILADEINRTPPKTQSALLQAMQEFQISVGNTTYPLAAPFLVLATQNPIEQEGTYPLPEAQLDRFMLNIIIDYPDFEEEKQIVISTTSKHASEPKPVISHEAILNIQSALYEIPISDHVLTYAVRLVRATRPASSDAPDFIKKWVTWGAGPRASQYLIQAAKIQAALEGRLSPAIDDVRKVADMVLRHRVLVSYAAEADGFKSSQIIEKLIQEKIN